ncbi:MAG: NAD(P)-binding domain-containing protein [Planctomycetes bacterium]|nr:NAD(P)-binding domain-containing protein [Planctomycetota bacterium]
MGLLSRYTRWLHTGVPAGTVEKLPRVAEDGATNVPGLYVVGDLTGIPLLKFSADSGTRAVRTICDDAAFAARERVSGVVDLVIVGGGVSGFAAALEARSKGLDFVLLEASQPFSTIVNFPRGKPIYTYPAEMTPAGDIQFEAEVKEPLLDELRAQTLERGVEPRIGRAERVTRRGKHLEVELAGEDPILAHRVIVAIGRSGNFRELGVPGEDLDKVSNRLHDPKDFAAKRVLVVGGGDSALETAIAIAQCGGEVTLSYRKPEFSRPKPENVERLEQLRGEAIDLRLGTTVTRIDADRVTLSGSDAEHTIENDAVFAMIGREAPLDFFRRSGVRIRGETRGLAWIPIVIFFVLIALLYDWKNDGFVSQSIPALAASDTFPNDTSAVLSSLGQWWADQVADKSTIIGTLAVSASGRSFYYTLLYSLTIVWFGILRIRRRKTPYVKLQTLSLIAIQVLPLFLLPEVILPWLGYNGWFDSGVGRWFADSFFESYISADALAAHDWPSGYHPRAYWRSYGFVLAWPLMVYNIFTPSPIWPWIVLGSVQTFVLIPLLVRKWGKGAYCGWICSCGGLAETMGDTLRDKMPHGPVWNRLNMLGQAILGIAFVMLALRIWGWANPGGAIDSVFDTLLNGSKNAEGKLVQPVSWKWGVDVLLGGVLGVGLYVKYSGRVWCRFACPLAALMHVYAKFSRFRILADKKKCISCNVCTSVCHMGIDVMNFANKGLPMSDTECVRCSAGVQSCPTGVLEFGEVDPATEEITRRDRLPASPVRVRESGSTAARTTGARARGEND